MGFEKGVKLQFVLPDGVKPLSEEIQERVRHLIEGIMMVCKLESNIGVVQSSLFYTLCVVIAHQSDTSYTVEERVEMISDNIKVQVASILKEKAEMKE